MPHVTVKSVSEVSIPICNVPIYILKGTIKLFSFKLNIITVSNKWSPTT